jgi:hypothetical protein
MLKSRAYLGSLIILLLSSCNAFKQKVNIGPGTAEFRDHSMEILTMLGGAFALGLWLGWILWNKYKAMVDSIRAENESLTLSYNNLKAETDALKLNYTKLESDKNDLQTQFNSISWENSDYKSKIIGFEGDIESLMSRNKSLESEITMSYASTPESAEIPMEIISSPVDVHVEDLTLPVEEVELPTIEAPIVEIPEMELPEIDFSSKFDATPIELPLVEVPEVQMPTIEVPEIAAPVIEIPVFVAPPVEVIRLEPTKTITSQRVIINEPVSYKKTVFTTSRVIDEKPIVIAPIAEAIVLSPIVVEPSEIVTLVEEPVVIETPVIETIVETPVMEEVIVVTAPVIEEPAITVVATQKDDLKIVEGIGPKIEELLFKNNIYTYTQLAATPVHTIKEILVASGPSYAMHDPGTWPAQSLLAANGEWENLKSYQSFLNAGKRPS